MTANLTVRTPSAARAPLGDARSPSLADLLQPNATAVISRRRIQLPLTVDGAKVAYVVRSGVLALVAMMPGKGKVVLGLYFPGDVIHAAVAPDLDGIGLISAGPSEVLRIRSSKLSEMLGTASSVAAAMAAQLNHQQARQTLHVATIGCLTSEQRVLTFLVKLANQIGRSTPGSGVAIDVPLTRSDMATYLALNPDTLSRHMSRLKQAGLVEHGGRGRVLIRDLDALMRECELTGALQALSGLHHS